MASIFWIAPILTGAFITESALKKRVSVGDTVSFASFILTLLLYSHARNMSRQVAMLMRKQNINV